MNGSANIKTSTDKTPTPWSHYAIILVLSALLALSWLHGRLLQKQGQEIRALKDEIQMLIEALEQGNTLEGEEDPGGTAPIGAARIPSTYPDPSPMRVPTRNARGLKLLSCSLQSPDPEKMQPDPAREELENARKSAQEAVAAARNVKGKLSIEENAKKAEEKAKLNETGRQASQWVLAGLGIALAALIYRLWQRWRASR